MARTRIVLLLLQRKRLSENPVLCSCDCPYCSPTFPLVHTVFRWRTTAATNLLGTCKRVHTRVRIKIQPYLPLLTVRYLYCSVVFLPAEGRLLKSCLLLVPFSAVRNQFSLPHTSLRLRIAAIVRKKSSVTCCNAIIFSFCWDSFLVFTRPFPLLYPQALTTLAFCLLLLLEANFFVFVKN